MPSNDLTMTHTDEASRGATRIAFPKRPLLSKIPDRLTLLVFCTILLIQMILSLREKSATMDETIHLPAGYLHLKFGDYSFNPEHPPLVKILAALPLLFLDVNTSPRSGLYMGTDWSYAHRFLYTENDADRFLFLGRMAVMPLALLLGCVVFLWAKQLWGRAAAIFALVLYSFEPNLLAHGGLVHTDLGATCFMFLTVYGFYRLVHGISVSRLLFAGFSLGLALVTKFSTLLLLPMLVVLGVAVVVAPHSIEVCLKGVPHIHVASRMRKLLILVAAVIGMGFLAYMTIWAAYRFRYEAIDLPGQRYEVTWDQVLPKHIGSEQVILWMKEAKLLPEAYLYGLAAVFKSLKRLSFLMGEISTDGWWYYFIITFLLKTPLALLLLLALTCLTFRQQWRNDRVAVLFLLTPILIYFGIASASRMNLGHRHILPLYPFLFVLVGSLVPWAMRQRTLVKGGWMVIVGWYVFSSISIFPHYLAYFNELTGGPEYGYRYLVNSNLDWGQDLKGLKRYMDEHSIERIWLSYFGAASPDYHGITYDYLPSYLTFDPKHLRQEMFQLERLPPLPGTVAISATNLQGVYLPLLGLNTDYFAFYRQQPPIAKIGYTIFIYHFE